MVKVPKLRNPLRYRFVQRASRPVRAHLNRHTTRITRSHVAALRASVEGDLDDLRTSVENLRKSVGREQDQRATQLKNAIERSVNGQVTSLNDDLGAARTTIGRLTAQLRDVTAAQGEADERLRRALASVAKVECSIRVLLGPTGRHVTRLVDEQDVSTLVEQLAFAADEESVAVAVHQAYRLLLELETRGVGRVAGSTANVLAKLAGVALVPPPCNQVLEVGTLHGIGAVGVHRQLRRAGVIAELTIVDPLAGYQMQPDRGVSGDVSSTPVTREVVDANLALGDVAPADYRLIEGLSTSPDVHAQIDDRRYGVIVIDGDHSAEIVYSDLRLADRLAAPGALILLDDYDDPAWPGVAEAVDRYRTQEGGRLTLVGVAATTAFLRAD